MQDFKGPTQKSMKIKLIKRRLYKVQEDFLEEQKTTVSTRKREVWCKISKWKKQTKVFFKKAIPKHTNASMTPLVQDIFEAVFRKQMKSRTALKKHPSE